MEEIKKYRDYGENKIEDHLGFLFCPSLPYDRVNLEDGKAEYDEIYNNYKAKIKLELVFKVKKGSTGNILDYVITVPAKWNSNNYPCLRGLTTQGRLNLDLLNSGLSALRGWRFWNNPDSKYTKIALIFELYPRENEVFKNLTIKFYDVSKIGKYLIDEDAALLPSESLADFKHEVSGELNNGNTTIEINWGDKLLKCKLYKVKLSYVSDYNGTITNNEVNNLWLLTTRLFNDCYDPGDKYVANYCSPETTSEIATINNKLKIKLKFKEIDKLPIVQTTEYSTEGSLISDSDQINFTSIQTDKISVLSDRLGLEIENLELYPDYITLIQSSSLVKALLNIKDTSEILNPVYNLLGRPLGSDKISSYLYIINTDEGISVISKEKVIGIGQEANLSNVFVKMSEALPELFNQTTLYCGVFPDAQHTDDYSLAFVESSSNEDHAANWFSHPHDYLVNGTTISRGDLYGYLLGEYNTHNRFFCIEFNTSHTVENEAVIWEQTLNDAFNHFNENNNLSCTWMFGKSDDDHKIAYHNDKNAEDYKQQQKNQVDSSAYTIIWWRSIDDENNVSWKASKLLIPQSWITNKSESEKLVKRLFGGDFYFCFIKSTEFGHSGLYAPTVNNLKFTFDDKIKLTIPVKLSVNGNGDNVISGLDKGKYVGVTFTLELEKDKEDNVECIIDHSNYNLNELIVGANGQQNIDKNGRKVDSDGQGLNVRNIYVEQNGKLRKITNPFVLSDDTIPFSDSNGNVCRYLYCSGKSQFNKLGKITLSSPSEDPYCILYHDSEDTERIYFRNVPLIPLINEQT